MTKIQLKPITEDNFIDAFNLELAPGQEKFVTHPIRSLAQAYVYRSQCCPFGPSGRVTLTCGKSNAAGLHIYETMGFKYTGAEDEDEFELSVNVD